MKWKPSCLLFFSLAVNLMNFANAVLDDKTLAKIKKEDGETPMIPTKNGYYAFVPCQCELQTNTPLLTIENNPITNTLPSKKPETNKYEIPQMRGVNRAGFEYPCRQGWGLVDGQVDDASIRAMKNWKVEVVRVPLNEDCWLGINGVNSAFSGDKYAKAVEDYVKRLRDSGLKVILDLHWSGGIDSTQNAKCKDDSAKCEKPMPDAAHAPSFWKSVAERFKNWDDVIFDLFNNPSPEKVVKDENSAWKCWKNGGSDCPGFLYKVAGMQDLVNAIRKTKSSNPLMIGGIRSANDLSKFLEFVPSDPKGKIIASWHSFNNDACNNENCWEREVAPVVKKYPVIAGEIAEYGCTHTYTDKLMDWLDEKKISYLGWTWNSWDCSSGPSLISDFNGTPTEFGKGLMNRMNKKPTSSDKPPTSSIPSTPNTGNQGSDGTSKPASSGQGASSKNQLRGVNKSGAEYSCIKRPGEGGGIFEGPIDDDAIKTMKTWNINVVRIPLNEDCWLAINGHHSAYTGDNYRNAVVDYVTRLRKHNLNVILDLHWTDGSYQGSDSAAKSQKPMPDKANAINFWKSVAQTFKGDGGIIFDLFNEPFPDMIVYDKAQAWKCLRNGGSQCPGFPFEAAGMQDLVNAVRSTGAKNQLMVPGLTWTNDLSKWLEHIPDDPINNLAASWHSYDFNACKDESCWNSQIGKIVNEGYTVIAGEIGQHGCSHWYIDGLMNWLDQKKISYLGWTWNTWDCSSGPALISNYDGTPTQFGIGLRDHLISSKK